MAASRVIRKLARMLDVSGTFGAGQTPVWDGTSAFKPRRVRSFDTIADLLAWAPAADDTYLVHVAGYHTAGDAKLPAYRYDPTDTTSPSNGGTVLRGTANAANRFKAVWDGRYLYAAWFGALCSDQAALVPTRFATLAAAQARYPWVTDGTRYADHVAIDAAVRAADASTTARAVRVPKGTAYLSSPLLIGSGNVTLQGDPTPAGTVLATSFGSGPCLLQYDAGWVDGGGVYLGRIATGASLVTGAGNAMRLGSADGNNVRRALHLTTEPNVGNMGGLTSWTFRGFFRVATMPGSGGAATNLHWPLWESHGDFGADVFGGVGLRVAADGSLYVKWGSQVSQSAGGLFTTGVTYFVAIVLSAGVVKVYLGIPGGTASQVHTFSATGTVVMNGTTLVAAGALPMAPSGMEVVTIGDGKSRHGDSQSVVAGKTADVYVDSFEWSNAARYTAAFTAPTAKLGIDANTLLVVNFEIDDPFVVGRVGVGRGVGTNRAYLLPDMTERQVSGMTLADVAFVNYEASSGPRFQDCVRLKLRNVTTNSSYQGFQFTGATFVSRMKNVISVGSATSGIGWLQGTQGMTGIYEDISVRNYACQFYVVGAVGGIYTGILSVGQNTYQIAYISAGNEVQWLGVQVDNEIEKAVSLLRRNVVIDGSNSQLYHNGGQVLSTIGLPLYECVDGGRVNALNVSFQTLSETTELIRFSGAAPTIPSNAGNCIRYAPGSAVPYTLAPQYLIWEDADGLHAPFARDSLARYLDVPVTLTDAATIATDASLGNVFDVTLGGNRVVAAPTNPRSGQSITYRVRQDATGGRTLTFATSGAGSFRFPANAASPNIAGRVGDAVDHFRFRYDATSNRWDGDLVHANLYTLFVPTDKAGLVMWLRPEGWGSAADATVVSAWPDDSGTGKVVTIGGSSLVKTGILNGYRALLMDGTDDVMTIPDFVIGTAIGVGRYTNGATFSGYDGILTPSAVVGSGFSGITGRGGNAKLAANVGNFYVNGAGPTFDVTDIQVFNSYSANFRSPVNPTTSNGTDTVTAGPGWMIGQDRGVAGRYWKGYWAEWVVYDTVLTTTERNKVLGYLTNKYATALG